MNPVLRSTFSNLFTPPVLSALIRGLCWSFPGLCRGLVEDAVQNAALDLLRSPTALPRAWEAGGPAGVRKVLAVASWRGCLRQLTGPAARFERPMDEPPDALNTDNPEDLLIGGELLARVEALVEEAARLFGGSKPGALADALEERLGSGDTDGAVARRHGVQRESLNRAKNWLADRLPRA